ncbi:MAG: RNA-processing protein [archaeon]|jgi:nucleolar protein 56
MVDKNELRKRLLKKAKQQIEENLSETEVHIIKSVRVLDDLDEIINLMRENSVDWVKRGPIGDAQKQLHKLQLNIENIEKEKIELSEFIEANMQKELPTFSTLAGAVLGARLLAEAGSKKRLAFCPSSTMQVLGAEKALFNHLKRKADCPKHGHIFNHPLIQKIPKPKRGKAARILAGKLSIAAKLDYFGTELNLNLKKEVENKINKL